MVNLRERKVLELKDFLGVDYTSSQFEVNKRRAIYSKNFINKDGVNQKRNGWIERANFGGEQINGFWSFNVGETEYIIVHAGTGIYKITNLGDTSLTTNKTLISTGIDTITDERSFGIVYNQALYILCGDYLVFGKNNDNNYTLRKVKDDALTYIPTTTIGIEDITITAQTRTTFEQVNLLQKKRKNTAKGCDTSSGDSVIQLDATMLDAQSDVEVLINTFTQSGDVRTATTKTFTNHGATKTNLYDSDDLLCATVVGTIDYTNGKITINQGNEIRDVVYETQLKDNITITFEKTVPGNASKITGCKFGILFGENGNSDRLFVAGNSDCANTDYFSDADDFTYFGANGFGVYGSPDVAIKAYSRLADGTLAIHKEQSFNEPNIYYRTMTIELATADNQLDKVIAPIKAGSIGVGVSSSFANANLSGDCLILADTGVYGIVLANNTATNERYARERSRYINGKLLKEGISGLADAVAIVYDNRYYLSVGDTVYIADARFKSTNEVDLDDTFNYEWWTWENTPVRVFGIYKNKLLFGTDDGRLCFFDDAFVDREFEMLNTGDITFTNATTFTINNNLIDAMTKLKVGDTFSVSTSDSSVGLSVWIDSSDIVKVEDNKIFVEDISKMIEEKVVYLSSSTSYKMSNINRDEGSFQLVNSSNEVQTITQACDIFVNIATTKYEVIEKTTAGSSTTFKVAYEDDDAVVEFQTFSNPIGSFNYKTPVECVWETPIFNLSSNIYAKKLQSITLCGDAKVRSVINFGYKTRENLKSYENKGVSLFSFDDINFANFSFVCADFPNAYTKKTCERKFNYIMFRFGSSNDAACSVNSLTALYTIIRKNRGVV